MPAQGDFSWTTSSEKTWEDSTLPPLATFQTQSKKEVKGKAES